jgi:hypothetical protein
MIVSLTTFVGTLCYFAGVTCGRAFASAFALLGAAAVPLVLIG